MKWASWKGKKEQCHFSRPIYLLKVSLYMTHTNYLWQGPILFSWLSQKKYVVRHEPLNPSTAKCNFFADPTKNPGSTPSQSLVPGFHQLRVSYMGEIFSIFVLRAGAGAAGSGQRSAGRGQVYLEISPFGNVGLNSWVSGSTWSSSRLASYGHLGKFADGGNPHTLGIGQG